jgi:hypothetical protein
MRSNERKHIVDRRDFIAGDFLIQELRFEVVDGCGRQRNEHSSASHGREYDPAKLDITRWRIAVSPLGTAPNVKHLYLRRSSPPSQEPAAETTETLNESYPLKSGLQDGRPDRSARIGPAVMCVDAS